MTSNSGKYLTNNGSAASWSDDLTVDGSHNVTVVGTLTSAAVLTGGGNCVIDTGGNVHVNSAYVQADDYYLGGMHIITTGGVATFSTVSGASGAFATDVYGTVSCYSINIGSAASVDHTGNAAFNTVSAGMSAFQADGSGNVVVNALSGTGNIILLTKYDGTGQWMQYKYATGDPSTPPSANAILYLRDNGSGKAQLAIQFPSGSPVVLATES